RLYHRTKNISSKTIRRNKICFGVKNRAEKKDTPGMKPGDTLRAFLRSSYYSNVPNSDMLQLLILFYNIIIKIARKLFLFSPQNYCDLILVFERIQL
ncbi:MAG: hypothetical protein LBR56_09600, partial [Sporomusaceae bacterium]|nr:hypothetical protein [Sporomusaceae bacterium]